MSQEADFQLDPSARRRLVRWGVVFAGLLLVLFFGSSLIRLNADYLWYRYDAGAMVVFSTQLSTRLILFMIGTAIACPVLVANALLVLKGAEILGHEATSLRDAVFERLAGAINRTRDRLAKPIWIVGSVAGLLFGIALSRRWDLWLGHRNAVPFEKTDPVFGQDFSFYVFTLPLLESLLSWTWTLWFICALVAGLAYFAAGGVANMGGRQLLTPSLRYHILILAAAGLALAGASIWLSRYGLLTVTGPKFAGPGHAELQGLGGRTVTALLLWIAAVVTLLTFKRNKPFAAPIAGALGAFVIYVVSAVIWPAISQSVTVNPNEIKVQQPYIARAIAATRWSYQIDKIEVRPFNAQVRPTAAAIAEAQTTLLNMRLWDPFILRQNVEGLQALRDYFHFPDIDVDRYELEGKQRMVMLGVRELSVEGLDRSRRTWQNLHLQYTHGSGIVAAAVNEAQADGNPVLLLRDVPPVGNPGLALSEPRIYYGDMPDSQGRPDDRYVIVRSRLAEFDFTMQGETESRWSGSHGIPIGGGWSKLLFAFIFGDQDILLSRDIVADSRLLWRRNIRVRAQHLLPFLQWDRDPYIVIIEGRPTWIMDGYAVTDAIPYSQPTTAGQTRLNYIRNVVKLTIDAYTGDWNAYIVDENEPIVKTYSRIYPGLMKSQALAPAKLRAHFRYPEDLFSIQSHQLTRYHVTDPLLFFRGADVWEIPSHSGGQGSEGQTIPPYYVQMKLPDEEKEGFLLILPFATIGRPNMIGYLAAHCDPKDYGRLTLYTFPAERNINGPEQQEAQFQTEPNLSARLTLLGQGGSRILPGNLLVVPIGESVMYVKTLFLVSERAGIRVIPQLRIVVLAWSDKIVFDETYDAALKTLLATVGTTAPTTAGTVAGTAAPQPAPSAGAEHVKAKLAEAVKALEEADAALRAGDWMKYGEAQARLKQLIKEAASISQ